MAIVILLAGVVALVLNIRAVQRKRAYGMEFTPGAMALLCLSGACIVVGVVPQLV